VFVAPNLNIEGKHEVEVKTQDVPVHSGNSKIEPVDLGAETTQSASFGELLQNL
jgi:hypothetical protein